MRIVTSVAALCSLLAAASPVWAQSTAEVEPNNTPATANPAALGGRVTGAISDSDSTPADVDYFMLNATAGQTIYVDVDANEFGTGLQPYIALYASDGTTKLAANTGWDGFDPYIAYVAATSDRYYVMIAGGLASAPLRYTINFTQASCPLAEDREPNNSRQTAQVIAVGSTVHGVSCPFGDQDFVKFSAAAGTVLDVQIDTLRRDPPLPSYGCACPVQAYVALLGSDGTFVAGPWSSDEKSPHFRYEVTKADTYFVQVRVELGGIRYAYTLHVRALDVRPPGPGDSVIVRATLGDQGANTIVAAPDGVLYTSEGYRIWRFDRNGNQTLFHFYGYELGVINDLAFDAFGNFLAATDQGVYRITPGATATRIVDTPVAKAIAVAPDGSFWVSFPGGYPGPPPRIGHYNPVGRELATYDVSSPGAAYHLAVGPSGDLYFSTVLEIYRLGAGNPQLVLRSAHPGREFFGQFAFDADGNIYVPNLSEGTALSEGTVTLYGPNGAVLTDPFSWWPVKPSAVVFGRNPDGTPNSRLFALDGVRLLELNPAGVRSRGLPLGRTTNITVTAAVKGLLRNAGLSDADRAFLAGLGNENGRYDVGDLRAFLLAMGELDGVVP